MNKLTAIQSSSVFWSQYVHPTNWRNCRFE